MTGLEREGNRGYRGTQIGDGGCCSQKNGGMLPPWELIRSSVFHPFHLCPSVSECSLPAVLLRDGEHQSIISQADAVWQTALGLGVADGVRKVREEGAARLQLRRHLQRLLDTEVRRV